MGPVKQMDEGPSTRPLRPLWSDIYCDSDFILLGHRSTSLNVGMREALSLRDFGFVMFLYYGWSFKFCSLCLHAVLWLLIYITHFSSAKARESMRERFILQILRISNLQPKVKKAAQCFKTIMFNLIFRAYI